VLSTEQLATRTGDAIGGLLNATFGNAPELIIALVALRAGFFDMVRASIIGAILANLMLAMGAAFLLGGLRHHMQEYNAGVARLYSSMMLISAVSLGVPSAFNRFFSPESTIREEKLVNLGTAVVLLAAYGLYLVFLLKTHPDYFESVGVTRPSTATKERNGAWVEPSAAWSALPRARTRWTSPSASRWGAAFKSRCSLRRSWCSRAA
jgi:Ca2+:H+ antiporter